MLYGVRGLGRYRAEEIKGTLAKVAARGEGLAGRAAGAELHLPKIFRKNCPMSFLNRSLKALRYLINRSPIQVLEWESYYLALYIFYRRENLCKLDRMGIVWKMKVPSYMVLI